MPNPVTSFLANSLADFGATRRTESRANAPQSTGRDDRAQAPRFDRLLPQHETDRGAAARSGAHDRRVDDRRSDDRSRAERDADDSKSNALGRNGKTVPSEHSADRAAEAVRTNRPAHDKVARRPADAPERPEPDAAVEADEATAATGDIAQQNAETTSAEGTDTTAAAQQTPADPTLAVAIALAAGDVTEGVEDTSDDSGDEEAASDDTEATASGAATDLAMLMQATEKTAVSVPSAGSREDGAVGAVGTGGASAGLAAAEAAVSAGGQGDAATADGALATAGAETSGDAASGGGIATNGEAGAKTDAAIKAGEQGASSDATPKAMAAAKASEARSSDDLVRDPKAVDATANGATKGAAGEKAATSGIESQGDSTSKPAKPDLHPARASHFSHLVEGFVGSGAVHRPVDILAGLDRSVAASAMNRTTDTQRPTPLQMLPIEIGMQAVRGVTNFQIRLDPAELGRVEVKLQIHDNGEVKAHLSVDRVETLQMLRRDASTLQNAFEQAGLKQSPDGLTFSLRGEGQQGQQQEQRRQSGSSVEIPDELAMQAQLGEAVMRRVYIPNSSIDRMV